MTYFRRATGHQKELLDWEWIAMWANWFYRFSYSCITFRQKYRRIRVRICEVEKTLSLFSVVSCRFEDDVYNEITNIIL